MFNIGFFIGRINQLSVRLDSLIFTMFEQMYTFIFPSIFSVIYIILNQVNLNDGMEKILKSLDKYPVKTRLSLSGTLIVARDIAHAKLKDRLNSEGSLPQYLKDHPVYYAGPAKTPEVSTYYSYLLQLLNCRSFFN